MALNLSNELRCAKPPQLMTMQVNRASAISHAMGRKLAPLGSRGVEALGDFYG